MFAELRLGLGLGTGFWLGLVLGLNRSWIIFGITTRTALLHIHEYKPVSHMKNGVDAILN